MLVGEVNHDWGSPWRALQTLLANQFGMPHALQMCDAIPNDAGPFPSSWIERARQRQTRVSPTRQ